MASYKTLFFACLLVAGVAVPMAQATIPINLPPIVLPPIVLPPIVRPPPPPVSTVPPPPPVSTVPPPPPVITLPPIVLPPIVLPPVSTVPPPPPVSTVPPPPPVITLPPIVLPPVSTVPPPPPVSTVPPPPPVITLPPIALPPITGVIRVQGILFCTVNGTINPGSGLLTPRFPNATVELRCGPANTTVASVTTNSMGQVSTLLDPLLFNVPQILTECRLVVTTPLASCNATLPPTGTLTSTLKSLGTTFASSLPVFNIGTTLSG